MANPITKYPVPLIFKKILKDQMSGELVVESGGHTKTLYFNKGHLSFAQTTVDNERIGEILCATGKITRQQLNNALEIKKNNPRRLGEILAKMYGVSMRDVFMALVQQANTIASSTFPLTQGEWKFTIRTPQLPNNQDFKIRIPDIMRRGVKKIEDIFYYKRRFLYRAPVITALSESTVKKLTPDEMDFYNDLSHHSNIAVEKIIGKFKLPELVFWHHIILMYLLNIADFVEFTVDEKRNEKIEEINHVYQQIKAGKMDYQQLFGASEGAALQEIEQKYSAVSEKYDPNEVVAPPDSSAVFKASYVHAEIRKAFQKMKEEEKKKELIQKAAASGQTSTPAATPVKEKEEPQERENPVKAARELYVKANYLYKKKMYPEAAALLEQALKKDDSKANYYLLLGICQSKLPMSKKDGERNLFRAAEMEPWNADPLFALGELYRSENMHKKAKTYFKKALAINMDHVLAGKAVDEMGGITIEKKSIFSIFGKK